MKKNSELEVYEGLTRVGKQYKLVLVPETSLFNCCQGCFFSCAKRSCPRTDKYELFCLENIFVLKEVKKIV